MGSTTRIQKLFSLRQVQEVEQTLGVLTFCVVSLVILQTTAVDQLRRLARGGATKTGEEEGTAFNQLLSRVSLTLMKGLCSMVLNKN